MRVIKTKTQESTSKKDFFLSVKSSPLINFETFSHHCLSMSFPPLKTPAELPARSKGKKPEYFAIKPWPDFQLQLQRTYLSRELGHQQADTCLQSKRTTPFLIFAPETKPNNIIIFGYMNVCRLSLPEIDVSSLSLFPLFPLQYISILWEIARGFQASNRFLPWEVRIFLIIGKHIIEREPLGMIFFIIYLLSCWVNMLWGVLYLLI